MRHQFPEHPITVLQIQSYIRRHGIDCNKNSRETMAEVEDHFGVRVRIANLILALLWSGFGVLPRDGGNVFQIVEIGD